MRIACFDMTNLSVRIWQLGSLTDRYDINHSIVLRTERTSNKTDTPSDEVFVTAVAEYIRGTARHTNKYAHMYVETAGGESSQGREATRNIHTYPDSLIE